MYVYVYVGGVNGSGNSAADQIPLLLKMNEDELALQKVLNVYYIFQVYVCMHVCF